MMSKDLDDETGKVPKKGMYEAIILCGGEGWTLKPDEWTPKPLLNITPEESLLDRQIRWLIDGGIQKIVLASNRSFSESKLFENPRVEVCIERRNLGTGGAVKRAFSLVETDKFYVMNVDDIVFYDPKSLFEIADRGAAVLLARPPLPFGKITLREEDDSIKDFEEHPMLDIWVNSGHYVFSKEMVTKYFPTEGDLESKALHQIIKANRLRGLRYLGEWFTLNTMKDLTRVQEYFRNSIAKKPRPRK
nr:sugar phosphate nucleotidyltransferase [Candidatus Njordarchaeota archaeon]